MVKVSQREILWQIASARMPTKWGMFEAIGFERAISNGSQAESAIVLTRGDLNKGTPLLRIHSQCFTGELLGSLRCDCNAQLEMAIRMIADQQAGVLIYEYQEGRGIGLMAKLEAYELQDAGFDTVEANHALGYKADYRDFGLPVAILRRLGVRRVRLLTNNPRKTQALRAGGISVTEELRCEAVPTAHSISYLRTKKEKMGHTLNLCRDASIPVGGQLPDRGIEAQL